MNETGMWKEGCGRRNVEGGEGKGRGTERSGRKKGRIGRGGRIDPRSVTYRQSVDESIETQKSPPNAFRKSGI